jgi:hypothetical protein
MAGYGVNYGQSGGGYGPYIGPTRAGAGDPAFDAWQQRQFSTQPFSGSEIASGAHKMPQYAGGGRPLDPLARLKAEADPRDIMNSPAMKRLMDLANSGGRGMAAADEAAAPAVARMREYLASNDPLGTGNLPQLVRQRGMSELRGAASGAKRRVEESFGGMHGSADPSAMAFMKELVSGNAAAGMGEVERGAAEAGISERAASESFRKGVSDSLLAWGGTRGGLAQQDDALAAGAAGQALTAESFGRNTWAQVFAQLLGAQMRGGGDTSRPVNNRRDENPFPGIDSFGSYLGGWEPDDATGRPSRRQVEDWNLNWYRNQSYENARRAAEAAHPGEVFA